MSSTTEAITSQIETLLPPSIKNSVLIEYIAHAVSNPLEYTDEHSLFDHLNELFIWFGFDDANSVHLFCQQLANALHQHHLVPSLSPEQLQLHNHNVEQTHAVTWVVPFPNDLSRLVAGFPVLAQFALDEHFYQATVERLAPDNSVVVFYNDYGTLDCVRLDQLRIPTPELLTLLTQYKQFQHSPFDNLSIEQLKIAEIIDSANATIFEQLNHQQQQKVSLSGTDNTSSKSTTTTPSGTTTTTTTTDVANNNNNNNATNVPVLTTLGLLPQPVRIADFSEQKQQIKNPEDELSALDTIVTKRDLKLQAKEKRRLDLLRQRELKRAEREQQMRENALKTYLSNSESTQSRKIDIHVQNFSLYSPDGSKELLEDATFSLNQGRIYGLIGCNGVGKTTLLKAIANYECPGVPPFMRIVHVEQESRGDGYSALQAVLRSDVEREILIREEIRLKALLQSTVAKSDEEKLENIIDIDRHQLSVAISSIPAENEAEEERYEKLFANLRNKRSKITASATTFEITEQLDHVYQRMETIDAAGAEARAAEILSGLQFSPERMNIPSKHLSGGWRMRVNLAAALFTEPDLLLLDEPTNHLDFPAVLWLEKYLQNYANTVVVISHDRMFLNNVISDVLHLYHRKLVTYRGDYSSFEQVREEQLKLLKRTQEAQQEKQAHIQEFIDKFRFSANRAALVQSRIKALKKMETVEIEDDVEFTMTFPSPEDPLGDQSAIEVNDISFSYNNEKPFLLHHITCNVDGASRVGILGANGIGKTTLLRCMMGELTVSQGNVYRNSGARISTFAQHHMEKLKPQLTPLELLQELYPKIHPQFIRRHLGRFGVNGSMQTQIISSLSGGQKSRVAFSILMWERPHVIVMDEPTNHLDLETVDALIGAVRGFQGGVVIVSHDQHFLSAVCHEYWVVAHGQCKRFLEFNEAKEFSAR